MANKAVLNAVLFLRILTLLALAASVMVMGLNNFNDDGYKIKFFDLISYRYVFATGVIGFLYTLIQIPFAVHDAVKEKRWVKDGCLPEFDFYGDKVIAFLLASGVGLGFGVVFELKRVYDGALDDKSKKYLDRGNISTALLLVGFVFMAILSILSSYRSSSSGRRGFFK